MCPSERQHLVWKCVAEGGGETGGECEETECEGEACSDRPQLKVCADLGTTGKMERRGFRKSTLDDLCRRGSVLEAEIKCSDSRRHVYTRHAGEAYSDGPQVHSI